MRSLGLLYCSHTPNNWINILTNISIRMWPSLGGWFIFHLKIVFGKWSTCWGVNSIVWCVEIDIRAFVTIFQDMDKLDKYNGDSVSSILIVNFWFTELRCGRTNTIDDEPFVRSIGLAPIALLKKSTICCGLIGDQKCRCKPLSNRVAR